MKKFKHSTPLENANKYGHTQPFVCDSSQTQSSIHGTNETLKKTLQTSSSLDEAQFKTPLENSNLNTSKHLYAHENEVISIRNKVYSEKNFTLLSSVVSKKSVILKSKSSSARSFTPINNNSNSSRRSKSPYTGTPGSVHSFLDRTSSSTLMAVVEGRGQARKEIGIAVIDSMTPILTLAQFSDTHTYSKTISRVSFFNPFEILVTSTSTDSGVIEILKDCTSVSKAKIINLQRRYFNDIRGLAMIKNVAQPQCAVHIEREVESKYYCLAAASALIKYVENSQNFTYVPHSLYVQFISTHNNFTIDHWSCKQLELVCGLDGSWENSLFGAMKHTSTTSGTKLLRSSLLQPLTDLEIIVGRNSAIQYLIDHPDLFYTLKSIIARFPDLDWLLSMCIQHPKEENEQHCEQRLNHVIGLKNTLELLKPLSSALNDVDDNLLASAKKTMSKGDIIKLQDNICKVLHEDARLLKGSAAMKTQRCFAIKFKVNNNLDVVRRVYSEIIDKITEVVNSLALKFKLPLKVGHNVSKGFHIIIPLENLSSSPKLPNIFIQVSQTRKLVTCTTEELYQLSERSRDLMRQILLMSNSIISDLMVQICSKMGLLYNLAETLATIDLIICLTHVASVSSWTRPIFTDHVSIRNGKHAILDLISHEAVPNNTVLNEENRVMIITGPNMSGKTTFLRQMTLIQILAQIGSFVPAELAHLRKCTQIFTLLYQEGNPENNASSFQMQMNTISNILEKADARSFVILDELGLGTNLEEGIGISWAVMEMLIHKKCITLLSTHTIFLTYLSSMYPQVVNYFMDVTESNDGKIKMSYILKQGITDASNYGLSLAAITTLPSDIIKSALELSTIISKSPQIEKNEKNIAIYYTAHRLITLAVSTNTEINQNSSSLQCSQNDEDEDENKTCELQNILQDLLKDFYGKNIP